MPPQEPISLFSDEFNLTSGLLGLAVTVVAFFLGWGLKDVKKRYDRIPEIETDVAVLKQEIKDLKELLGRGGIRE